MNALVPLVDVERIQMFGQRSHLVATRVSYVDAVPLPRAIARLNKRYTNWFIEPAVARLQGFAVVVHTGRRSGMTYRTPVYCFAAAEHLLVALTYGPSADWAQNVGAGGGAIDRHGLTRVIDSSAIVDRQLGWPHLPLAVRVGLRILRVTDFLQITVR